MRWNPAIEWWNASKFSKHKAIDFLKGYVFVNCLLSKSSRGMHYEAESIDYFRWKFWKSHMAHGHARWLWLHKDCAELEEPFELWNLDFIGARERIKVPHKITHSMVLLTKLENQDWWSISNKIQSQEDFIKKDIKCFQCKKWLGIEGQRFVCEDWMPNRFGDFAVFWNKHWKSHKATFSKHIINQQSFVGISWIDDYKEIVQNKQKCCLWKLDLLLKDTPCFYVYKNGLTDRWESLIVWKQDFLRLK